MINSVVEKLDTLQRKVAAEKGPFAYFALLLPEEAQDRWDLVVSAPWLDKDSSESLRYIASQLRERLASEEMVQLSRVLILSDRELLADDAIPANTDGGIREVHDIVFLGLPIESGYIFASNLDTLEEVPSPS